MSLRCLLSMSCAASMWGQDGEEGRQCGGAVAPTEAQLGGRF